VLGESLHVLLSITGRICHGVCTTLTFTFIFFTVTFRLPESFTALVDLTCLILNNDALTLLPVDIGGLVSRCKAADLHFLFTHS